MTVPQELRGRHAEQPVVIYKGSKTVEQSRDTLEFPGSVEPDALG